MVPARLCLWRRHQRSYNDRGKPCWLCHRDRRDSVHGQPNHGKFSRYPFSPFSFDLNSISCVFGKGLRFLISACACLFVGVQLMFEYRCVANFRFLFVASLTCLIIERKKCDKGSSGGAEHSPFLDERPYQMRTQAAITPSWVVQCRKILNRCYFMHV